jgi:hypothetical protein
MRSIVPLFLLAALAAPAAAGPGTLPTFICKTEVHVVGGEPAFRFVHPAISGVARDPDDVVFSGQCAEGCYVEPLRIVPDGVLAKGRRYVALLRPAGGATCSTTAEVITAFPIPAIDPLGALFGV